MQVISIILNYALHSIPYGPPMNYALCSPLLSHMQPIKLCPMTTMHPLPSYAYFIHDHLDIPSATTILRPPPLQTSEDLTNLTSRATPTSSRLRNLDTRDPQCYTRHWYIHL